VTDFAQGIYRGRVMHHRLKPSLRFTSRTASLLLDIDALPATAARLRLLSHNRFNLFGFDDRDHGPRDGSPLRPWIDRLLAAHGFARAARVRLLCYPRVLGYVFNPLSVYFCENEGGELYAIVHEVKNTFGEQHAYVLPATARGGVVRQACAKRFYVSPFLPLEGGYRFAVRPPAERVSIVIRQSGPEGLQLVASLTGDHAPLSDAELARVFVRFPLMTLKVIASIHWQALKLWLHGARYRAHRPACELDAVFDAAERAG
jgi:DUF1365 family protein